MPSSPNIIARADLKAKEANFNAKVPNVGNEKVSRILTLLLECSISKRRHYLYYNLLLHIRASTAYKVNFQ